MGKFSYGLEFYKNKIYSLDQKDLFKEKVLEAEKIDNFFLKIVPNIEYIRPYILMSFKYRDELSYEDRILYIRGLVYASDYIDFNDLYNLYESFDYFQYYGDDQVITSKNSIWNYTAFDKDLNSDENFKMLLSSDEEKDEETGTDITIEFDIDPDKLSDNTFEIDKEQFIKLKESIEEIDDDNENNYISLEEKYNFFLNKIRDYMEYTIQEKINNQIINSEDIEMVLEGMSDWFRIIFTSINDLLDINKNELQYKNQNLYDFL